eukprot:scaffold4991_cov417-Prasinococcus_capsulatus_cf.AAC.8
MAVVPCGRRRLPPAASQSSYRQLKAIGHQLASAEGGFTGLASIIALTRRLRVQLRAAAAPRAALVLDVVGHGKSEVSRSSVLRVGSHFSARCAPKYGLTAPLSRVTCVPCARDTVLLQRAACCSVATDHELASARASQTCAAAVAGCCLRRAGAGAGRAHA